MADADDGGALMLTATCFVTDGQTDRTNTEIDRYQHRVHAIRATRLNNKEPPMSAR